MTGRDVVDDLAELLGRPRAEVLAMTWTDLVRARDELAAEAVVEEAALTLDEREP